MSEVVVVLLLLVLLPISPPPAGVLRETHPRDQAADEPRVRLAVQPVLREPPRQRLAREAAPPRELEEPAPRRALVEPRHVGARQ